MDKEVTKKRISYIIKSIAIIDLLAVISLIYMTASSIIALYSFDKNPELVSGLSYNGIVLFGIQIFVLMVFLFIFAFCLLKNKNWAIIGRIFLAAILIIYYLYNYIVGNSEGGNLFIFYNIIVILCLSFVQFRKR